MEHEFELIEQARRKAADRRRSHGRTLPGEAVSRAFAAEHLANYSLIQELHRGGQGVVYLARQKNPQREVAVKILREGPFAGAHDQARFEREVQVLASLRHPNIVAIHDSGTAGGFFYFAMDYIDGKPVDIYVESRRHSRSPAQQDGTDGSTKQGIRDVLSLFATICDAVNAAHLRGVIHRDLKPGNILIDATGTPHILDFGLAKLDASFLTSPAGDTDSAVARRAAAQTLRLDAGNFTHTGQFLGSPPWASPEQAEGRGAIDLRTDVYSLGVLLYQALTCQFPYRVSGSIREVIENIVHTPAPPPSRHLPTIDRDVDTIALKCLAKEPERRYQSAGELAADLRRYLAGEPIDARRASTFYIVRKTLKRHRVAASLLGALALTVVASSIVLAILWRTAEARRAEAENERRQAEIARSVADARAESLRVSAYFNSIALADAALKDRNGQATAQRLEECPPELRGWEWGFLFQRLDASEHTYRTHRWAGHVTFSPDGRRILTYGTGRAIHVTDLASRQSERTIPAGIMVDHLVVLPDGDRYFTGSRSNFLLRGRLSSDEPPQRVRVALEECPYIAASPNGALLAVGGQGNDYVLVFRTDPFEEMMRLKTPDDATTCVAFSPDGQVLAAGGRQGGVVLWSTRTWEALANFNWHPRGATAVTFTPDSRRLISAGREGLIVVCDLDNRSIRHVFDCQSDAAANLAISPDGSRLAADAGQAIRVWDLQTGLEEPARIGHRSRVSGVAIAPDGSRLISSDGLGFIKEWSLEPPQRSVALHGHRAVIRGLAVSPDGRVAVSASEDRTARVWDLQTREELVRFGLHRHPLQAVALSPDGMQVVTGGASGETRVSDGEIRVWDRETGLPLAEILRPRSDIYSLSFSPDGTRIVAGYGDCTAEIMTRSGRTLHRLTGHENRVHSLTYSADGTLLLTADAAGLALLRHAADGSVIRRVRPPATGQRAALSPDASRIATAGDDHVVRIWEVETGRMLHELRGGHTNEVQCLAFSPDGSRVVSSCYGNLVIVWDAQRGQPVLTLGSHESGVPAVAWSRDGRYIVSGSHDWTLRVWSGGN